MIGRTNASGGGGLDTDELTAVAGDVLKGKTAGVKGSDDPVTGTLELTGNAADANVLTGKTYYNTDAKTKRSGTMANNGAMSGSLNCGQSKSIPAGYTTGGTVTANSLASQTSATAAASHILSGQTAWVNGNRITGNMANRGAYGGVGNSRGNDAGNKRMWVRVPGGYYNENANVYLNWSDIASMAGLTADKIKKGVSIMNVLGSFEGYTTSPLYLYNNGIWSNLQTTGVTMTHTTKDGSCHVFNDEIYLSVLGSKGTNHYSIGRLNQTVNLTPYNYLKIVTMSNPIGDYIGLSTNASLTTASFSASTLFSAYGTIIVNVSSLNGNYYIYFYHKASSSNASGNSSLSIKEIYLSNS